MPALLLPARACLHQSVQGRHPHDFAGALLGSYVAELDVVDLDVLDVPLAKEGQNRRTERRQYRRRQLSYEHPSFWVADLRLHLSRVVCGIGQLPGRLPESVRATSVSFYR